MTPDGQATGLSMARKGRAKPMTTITLTGDNGYTPYHGQNFAAGTIIDASAASWIVANSRGDPETEGCNTGSASINRYPFKVTNAPSVQINDGTINGEVPQDTTWENTYKDLNTGGSCNSAAMRLENCANAVVEGWRIDQCWDGIRFADGCQGWTVRRVWASDARDDFIENDLLLSGTINDCLFDGCLVGLSIARSSSNQGLDGSGNEITINGLLLRMANRSFNGSMTHASPFKTDPTEAVLPSLRITNSVIAISNVNHESKSRLQRAWNRTVESSGNYYLNLSDDAMPGDYPKSFAALGGGDWGGFTVLQGQVARDFWDAKRAAWLCSIGH